MPDSDTPDSSEDQIHDLQAQRLADAALEMHLMSEDRPRLQPNAYRLAFADNEFLLRRETRGIRFQLELLKPDLAQQELGIDSTIVVFGSARFREPAEAERQLHKAQASGDTAEIRRAQALLRNAHYYEKSRRFAQLVADYSLSCPEQDRLYIATGGGPGIMEAANRGAHDRGVLNVGLNILLPHEQEPNPYISPELSFKFHYFALRKMHFLMRAKALVAFPGGFGTLDELFEVLTLVQCKKSKPVPIFLFGSDYWKRLLNLEVLVEEGAISQQDLELLQYVDEPEQAWEGIRKFYQLRDNCPCSGTGP
ncbi:TIGR00730 family Rossman fold protein [Malikia sp.]|uniref:LOG family protein n=1 Tax=Malikia sp. TaxID=2070706 RepID=UPI00262C4A53|nr:TIGR00730 family Rossman fold protein [Malikia sp.]MDD2729661.1 TIGR00730 family Rossman fold protein [Malikia sp.]